MELTLTKLSPANARLQTLFLRQAGGSSVDLAGMTWRLAPAPRMASAGITAYLRLGEVEVTVWLDEPGWRTAAAASLDCRPEDVAGFSDILLRAALECFFADAMSELEKRLGEALALERLEMSASTVPASACRFSLRRDDGPLLGVAWTAGRAPDGWLAALTDRLRALPLPDAAELPDDIPVPAAVLLAATAVTLSEYEGLAVGDVVMFPAGPERILRVAGRIRFAAAMNNGILTVEGKTMTKAVFDNDLEPDAADPNGEDAPEAPIALDGVEIELQARVGRLILTLAELRRLDAGQVVEFSTPVESPVTLTVGDRPVATGELVDVGGRIGVRITTMAER